MGLKLVRGHRRIIDLATHDEAHITIHQLADYLSLSGKTVLRWIRTGKLPAIRVGGCMRVSRADAIAFIERHSHKSE